MKQHLLSSVTVIFTHASLWAASFSKRNIGRGPYVTLVKMVVHEGFWAFVLLSGKFFLKMPLFALTHGAILNSYRKWRGITVFRVAIGKSIHYLCVSRFPHL